jgi:hypothetical protein
MARLFFGFLYIIIKFVIAIKYLILQPREYYWLVSFFQIRTSPSMRMAMLSTRIIAWNLPTVMTARASSAGWRYVPTRQTQQWNWHYGMSVICPACHSRAGKVAGFGLWIACFNLCLYLSIPASLWRCLTAESSVCHFYWMFFSFELPWHQLSLCEKHHYRMSVNILTPCNIY